MINIFDQINITSNTWCEKHYEFYIAIESQDFDTWGNYYRLYFSIETFWDFEKDEDNLAVPSAIFIFQKILHLFYQADQNVYGLIKPLFEKQVDYVSYLVGQATNRRLKT